MRLSVELESVVLEYFQDLGTSFSLKCAILWRHGEFEALLRCSARVEDYDSPADYFCAAAAIAFVKKLPGILDNDDARRSAAVTKWFEGESSCYRTNQRLTPFLYNLERDDRIDAHLSGVRAVVRELIGPCPPALLSGRHGPGATFTDRGVATSVPHKMSSDPTLTSDAIWFLPQFLGTAWGRFVASERELSFVRGNRFTTVPKTSLIDRSIAIEPSINVFYQLAIGSALRRSLRASHGWDLDTAQDVHRQVAARASVTREFATLDLSNASDTVAYNLVKLLLPRSWFEVMDALRSPMTTHPDRPASWVKLEKFSSMGNGFTFELETVLFSAIAIYVSRLHGSEGVLGSDVFVFGDDIIVRDEVVREVTGLLNYLGFTLNKEKSFAGMSPFRESCGADFWNGADVRPSYLKRDPANVQESFGVANRIYQASQRLVAIRGYGLNRAWRFAVSRVPLPYRRCFGPSGLGDAVIHGPKDKWFTKRRNSIRYIRGIKAIEMGFVPFSKFDPRVVLACAVYGTGNVGTPVGGRVPPGEGVIPRSGAKVYALGWLPYS